MPSTSRRCGNGSRAGRLDEETLKRSSGGRREVGSWVGGGNPFPRLPGGDGAPPSRTQWNYLTFALNIPFECLMTLMDANDELQQSPLSLFTNWTSTGSVVSNG